MPASVKQLRDNQNNLIYPKIAKEGLVEPINSNDVGISAINGLQSSNVQGALNELAGNLGKATYILTFLASGWTGEAAPYTQTVTCETMQESDVPIVGPNVTTANAEDANAQFAAFGKVKRYTTQDGSVIAYCYEDTPPDIDYSAIFKVL